MYTMCYRFLICRGNTEQLYPNKLHIRRISNNACRDYSDRGMYKMCSRFLVKW